MPPARIRKLTLEECDQAKGVTVVIDVLRAFSAEAYAFHQGAREIIAVSTVEEALLWKEREPSILVMGEVNGYSVPGFDLWNSPGELARLDLSGRRLVHRTTAGTQGIIGSARASSVYAASFVVARATANWLRSLSIDEVDFIITGQDSSRDGDEDAACADYISACLINEVSPDPEPYLARVHASDTGRRFYREAPHDVWMEDLRLCTMINRFNFAMQVQMEGSNFVIRKVDCP
jgi:2-phosphosulfolactate phosphatase